MKDILTKWNKYKIRENAYSMGTMGVNVASGYISSQCPQGQEQNGFHPDGTPFCRDKPELNKGQEIIQTRDELVDYVRQHPNHEIYLDKPRGSTKTFGTNTDYPLPFDYGEWTNLINPADDMGWDLIIVPSATKDDQSLIPVGFVAYNDQKPHKIGNDKIIIAPGTIYTKDDKEIIEDFFNELSYFNPVEWY
tara:strand:+ start:2269 stop:2844 length:576 start_codon:yes stop_codon:yes gene_type:complete